MTRKSRILVICTTLSFQALPTQHPNSPTFRIPRTNYPTQTSESPSSVPHAKMTSTVVVGGTGLVVQSSSHLQTTSKIQIQVLTQTGLPHPQHPPLPLPNLQHPHPRTPRSFLSLPKTPPDNLQRQQCLALQPLHHHPTTPNLLLRPRNHSGCSRGLGKPTPDRLRSQSRPCTGS